MHLAAGAVLDRALAGDAVDRLQVVLVVHRQFGALVDRGDVEAEAHGVAFQQQAHAVPSLREHVAVAVLGVVEVRSEEHTSELQSLMRISYAVFCLKKTKSTDYTQ